MLIDISEELAIADDTDAVIDMVADKLLAGNISATLRGEISQMIERIRVAFPGNDAAVVAEAIDFVVTSPEFAYQR